MSRPQKKRLHGMALILGGLLVFAFEQPKAASLEDTLFEKGILTREERAAIKAEKKQLPEKKEREAEQQEDSPVIVKYERPGFVISTPDGNWETNIKWRFQFRASHPLENSNPDDPDPLVPGDFNDVEDITLNIRRARIKVDGHGYRPWLKYKFEYDWPSNSLLDWQVNLERFDWLQLKVGQWKVEYNRERADSSGKQQFVDRSIVNRTFTIDRQQGIMLHGHLFPETLADLRYYAGVFTGMGRGAMNNDDNNLMYMARLQWNFLGRDLKFAQSDVEYHENPTGSIAFAAATNKSQCTRWSSTGCGNLNGYTDSDLAEPGQFRVRQAVEEIAFKYQGLSVQHEFHWKEIEDRVNETKTDLIGAYAQAGYFPHYLIPAIPKPLEVAFRYAFVDPNTSEPDDRLEEFTIALNWFFAEHDNKLTIDLSHLTLDQRGGDDFGDDRARLQWDITF